MRLPPALCAILLALSSSWPSFAAVVWQDAVQLATGGGTRGPWRQNDSRYDYVDDPAVAIDPRGEVAVAWVEQSRKDVMLQRFARDGSPVRAKVNVSRSPATFSWLPRVALGAASSADVYVLWQEIIFSGGSHGGDILFARSSDGGASFSTPLNLSSSVGGDGKGRISRDVWHNGSLDIAVGGQGRIFAAWTEYDGALWVSRSLDGGRSFSKPMRVAAHETNPARAPALALDGKGRVYLAWTVGEDAAADIRIAISDDGAAFGNPILVARTRGYSDAPKVAIDAQGVLHLAFTERDGGPFGTPRVHYTRSTDGGRSFEATRALSGKGGAYPALEAGENGQVVVAWEHGEQARDRARGVAMTISTDGGRSFTPPSLIPGSADHRAPNANLQGRLTRKLALGPRGAVAVVNSAFDEGRGSRVWLLRGRLEK